MLEDDEARVRRFRAAAALVDRSLSWRLWRSAPAMLAHLVGGLENASLISLDHDLVPLTDDETDPGSGYDVAVVLAELIPCCAILIHTSNTDRGNAMAALLRHAGWTVGRVNPFDDDWIEREWAPRAKASLARGGA